MSPDECVLTPGREPGVQPAPETARIRPLIDLGSHTVIGAHLAGPDGRSLSLDAITGLLSSWRSTAAGRVPAVLSTRLNELALLPATDTFGERPLVALISSEQLLDDPGLALRLTQAARERGWQIGLSDVGRTPATVAAVSIIEPAMIMLDRRIRAETATDLGVELMKVITRLNQSNQTAVVAGTDQPSAVAAAAALGATLRLGRVSASGPAGWASDLDLTFDLFLPPPLPSPDIGIHELASQRYEPRQARKPFLTALSRQLEAEAERTGASTVVMAAFQRTRHITDGTRQRYRRLQSSVAQVIMAAEDLFAPPVDGVRAVSLDAGDPLVDEWVLVVLGPSNAVLLSAREGTGEPGPDRDRRFDYVLSWDRDLAGHAARSMLTRL